MQKRIFSKQEHVIMKLTSTLRHLKQWDKFARIFSTSEAEKTAKLTLLLGDAAMY